MIKFDEIKLNPQILRALEDLDFVTLTPIQEKVIPHLLNSNKDLIGLAQTGTGKTAAFSLPILNKIDPNSDEVQAIILCPTRELAIQIAEDIRKFLKYLEGVSVLPVYGGERIDRQITALQNYPQILVGTPGRMLDLIDRRKINVSTVKWLVMDEADEMLNMGFKDELDAILEDMPEKKQTLLFSATMPRNVEFIARKYMVKAERIESESIDNVSKISHEYYVVHARDRYLALRRIADLNPGIYGIVFCRTKYETKEVADKLIQDHYSAEAIHGDLTQDQRSFIMNKFRNKRINILVATDVAARGIDVSDLTHIINYNLPEQTETYIHRSGRTGRAGSSGVSISIIHMKEFSRIRGIENRLGIKIEKKQIPLGEEICEKQLYYLIDKISNTQVDEAEIKPYLNDIYAKLKHLKKEDLIKMFVSNEFSRFLSFYKDSVDLNIAASQGHNETKVRMERKRGMVKFDKFEINIGSADGLGPKSLISLINKDSKLKSAEIGKIEIQRKHSFFEIEEGFENIVLNSFKNIRFYDQKIKITTI